MEKRLPPEVSDMLKGRNLEEMAMKVIYKNWKGEEAVRTVVPLGVRYGSSEWHKEDQWLLRVYDMGKQAIREYALGDWKGSPSE